MCGVVAFADTRPCRPRPLLALVCGKGYKLSPFAELATADGAWRLRPTALGAIHGSRLPLTALGAYSRWRLTDKGS